MHHLAVLGPANTFSDIAAEKYLENIRACIGSNSKKTVYSAVLRKYFTNSIAEIFDLVEHGIVAAGIVPIENNSYGSVRETLEGLSSKNVRIVDNITIPVHLCLICLTGANRRNIRVIISHPQPLGQSKKYLQKNFAKVALESSVSTGAAVEKLLNHNDKSIAVIAPEPAARSSSKLKILAKNIEDRHDNATTFAIIKKCNR